jgi:thiol-disulfide isomerase/thioredoxin
MRRSWLALSLVLAFPVLAQAPTPRRSPKLPKPDVPTYEEPIVALAPGDPAPELAGTTLDGVPKTVRWSDHAVNVVSYWATWCVPCKTEMPILQGLYAARAKDGLAVWGVEVDEGPANLHLDASRRFLADLKVEYPVIHESPGTSRKWGGISTVPTTFLVGRNGKILRKYVGATPSQTEGLVNDVNGLLDGRPLGTQQLAPAAETQPAKP